MDRLIKVGKITPKKSADIKRSRIGLGFEKLDRDIFDPEKAYPYVAQSGVKWARLQSGWQRTEREKGVYNFDWLDKIVDKMIAMGVEPWLCLCYGNDLYSPAAKTVYGAVGIPPIHTEEEKTAWANYVKATVQHFKGRIHYYEVWNEPDGEWCWKHGPDPIEVAEFNKATAIVCKETDPTCEVIGLSLCYKLAFAAEFAKTGVLDYLDGIAYHAYCVEEEEWQSLYDFMDRMRKEYGKPNLKIFQGESGTQSRHDGAGALRGATWTPLKQAKFLLRHLITDLGNNVEFTSYFTCVDMIEALNGTVGNVASYLDYGYFGILGANFDAEGRSIGTYTPKPSYYALQNLCSVFSEDFAVSAFPAQWTVLWSQRVMGNDLDPQYIKSLSFKRPNGSSAIVYWVPKNIVTETYDGTASIKLDDPDMAQKVLLTDLLTGTVYKINEDMIGKDGTLQNIPLTDSPLMITLGDFCEWENT